ncbi:MAG: hypothetical protein ACREB3_05080, partial [Burkholderiales bacterium]
NTTYADRRFDYRIDYYYPGRRLAPDDPRSVALMAEREAQPYEMFDPQGDVVGRFKTFWEASNAAGEELRASGVTPPSTEVAEGSVNYEYRQYTLPGYTSSGPHAAVDYEEWLFVLPPGFMGKRYITPHFPDAANKENTVFHIRLRRETVTDPASGKPHDMLFIEEIQSDLQQAARLIGFDTEVASRINSTAAARADASQKLADLGLRHNYESAFKEESGLLDVVLPGTDLTRAAYNLSISPSDIRLATPDEAVAMREYLTATAHDRFANTWAHFAPPEFPFSTAGAPWQKLALRAILRMAAERDLDGIVWTPGIVQRERYYDPTKVSQMEIRPGVEPGTIEVKLNLATNRNADVAGHLKAPVTPDGFIIMNEARFAGLLETGEASDEVALAKIKAEAAALAKDLIGQTKTLSLADAPLVKDFGPDAMPNVWRPGNPELYDTLMVRWANDI